MKRKIIFSIITVSLVLVLFFIIGNPSYDKNEMASSGKEFHVDAFRFDYSPNEITVNKGDRVKIIINNTDTIHGIRVPELGVSGNNVIELVADKAGEFTWYCNNMCGSGHMQMKGKLIVK